MTRIRRLEYACTVISFDQLKSIEHVTPETILKENHQDRYAEPDPVKYLKSKLTGSGCETYLSGKNPNPASQSDSAAKTGGAPDVGQEPAKDRAAAAGQAAVPEAK